MLIRSIGLELFRAGFRSDAFFIASVLSRTDFAFPFVVASSSKAITDDGFGSMRANEELASAEAIAELGALLAEGLMRLRAPKSSGFSSEFGESSLHFSPDQSGHVAASEAENTA